MSITKNHTSSFYRKLEIYTRVFILNFGNLSLLNKSILRLRESSPPVSEFTNINRTSLQGAYLNLSDCKLLLASFSLNKLNSLFKAVVINLLSMDNRIRINAKLITKLKAELSSDELNLLLGTAVYEAKSRLSEALVLYSFTELIEGIMAIYFKDLSLKLERQVEERFKLSYWQNKFEIYLEQSKLDELVNVLFSQKFPQTSLVIQQFNKN